jgi:hypothetical protein
MAEESLKKRVAALEAEVAQLKSKFEAATSDTPWWKQIWGSFSGDPAF